MNLSNINSVNTTNSTASDSSLVDRSSSSNSFEQLLSSYNTTSKAATSTTNSNAATTNTNTTTTANNNNTASNNQTETAATSTSENPAAPATSSAETAQKPTAANEENAVAVAIVKPAITLAQHSTKRLVNDTLTEDDANLDAETALTDVALSADDVLAAASTDTAVVTTADTTLLTEPDAATQSLLAMLTQPQLLPPETTTATTLAVPVVGETAITRAAEIIAQAQSVVTEPLQATSENTALTGTTGFTLNAKADSSTSSVRAGSDNSTDSRVTTSKETTSATDSASSTATLATTAAVHAESTSNAATTHTTVLASTTLPATTLAQATTTASATASATTPQLTAQVGTDAWQQNLGQQIVMFNKDGQYSAKLRLHPEELGSLQINMTMTDNQAQLHFVSAHSTVRAALEAAMPYLRTSLAENGIDLGQASVGSDSAQSGQQQSSDSQSAATRFDYLDGGIDGVGDTVAVPGSLQRAAAAQNGVDIFA